MTKKSLPAFLFALYASVADALAKETEKREQSISQDLVYFILEKPEIKREDLLCRDVSLTQDKTGSKLRLCYGYGEDSSSFSDDVFYVAFGSYVYIDKRIDDHLDDLLFSTKEYSLPIPLETLPRRKQRKLDKNYKEVISLANENDS